MNTRSFFVVGLMLILGMLSVHAQDGSNLSQTESNIVFVSGEQTFLLRGPEWSSTTIDNGGQMMGCGTFEFSPNGEYFSYTRNDFLTETSVHVLINTNTLERTTIPSLHFQAIFSWLPDSSGILYSAVVDPIMSNAVSIMQYDIASQNSTILLQNPEFEEYEASPRLSPDGAYLVYTLQDNGGGMSLVGLNDPTQVLLHIQAMGMGRVFWSPDSSGFLYVDLFTSVGLYFQPVNGDTSIPVFDDHASRIRKFVWSKDGQSIAFQVGNEIYIYGFQDGVFTYSNTVTFGKFYEFFDLSPDGTQLLVSNTDGDLLIIDVSAQLVSRIFPAAYAECAAWYPAAENSSSRG